MYSIMCVYMHHICIYNVYVYIFVVNFPPLSFWYIILGVLRLNAHIHITTQKNDKFYYFSLVSRQFSHSNVS